MFKDGSPQRGRGTSRQGFKKALRKLYQTDSRSSFGQNSNEAKMKNPPSFHFGKTKRFLNKTSLTDLSPGPAYNVRDPVTFRESPKWSLGNCSRVMTAKPKYEYYTSDVCLTEDVDASERAIRRRAGAALIDCGEPRDPSPRRDNFPGPIYYPKYNGREASTPKYSFRKEGMEANSPGRGNSSFTNGATSNFVGPGRYETMKSSRRLAKSRQAPNYSIPRSSRSVLGSRVARNDTYYTPASIGRQLDSRKKSSPIGTFGRSPRNLTKLGQVHEDVLPKTRVQMPHIEL